MKIRIFGVYPDGTQDTWLIEKDTIEEIRDLAMQIKESRGLVDAWSEDASHE